MARWVQRLNEETGKYEMIPVGEGHERTTPDGFVRRDFDPIVSPIDGTVIKNHRQYDDHCRKHNVVPSAEFSQEFIARKQKEREKVFTGEHSRKEQWRRKAEINEIINHMERNHGR